ncbi:MAG TPA: glycosyltransferase [Lacibacter sp.]|nr:glycosyltransferase [Lacibacter sp.]
MQADIAIVVAAYNRPASLHRLLQSLLRARYDGYERITLIISIDHSGTDACAAIADAFEWKFGRKEVIRHGEQQGLKKHLLSCGDLSNRFDAVIVLEDDLLVATAFYDYAQQAYAFYKEDTAVAGIALYRPCFNEVANCPFEPLDDGYDTYFMQVPCSWGQLWTREQWMKFRRYVNSGAILQHQHLLPPAVQQWPDGSSWKKLFYSYLSAEGMYFVYPRTGLSTNFGDTGQHLTTHQTVFQTPLLIGAKQFHFATLHDSRSVYDGYFELQGAVYNQWFHNPLSVSFDLNGSKPLHTISTEYVISSKKCKNPVHTFAVSCYPFELNILLGIDADEQDTAFFTLGATRSFTDDPQFLRLNEDVKRVFMNDAFIHNAALTELKQQKEFQLGALLLRPFRFLKNLGKRNNG